MFTHCSLFDFYRPSIADQVHIGYFSQDRSSQTEVSEVAQLKEMTEVLQNLVRVRFKVKNACKDWEKDSALTSQSTLYNVF